MWIMYAHRQEDVAVVEDIAAHVLLHGFWGAGAGCQYASLAKKKKYERNPPPPFLKRF